MAGERVGFVRLAVADDRLELDDLQVRAVAAEREMAAVRLRCFHDNPAYRLYERVGFVVVERGEDADWLERAV